MAELPVIIVVGGDDLALRVCEELRAFDGHDVVLLWEGDERFASRVMQTGARFVRMAPNDYEALRQVGILGAETIMPVSVDDRLNLQVALKARDLNPRIRLVLRQFNRALGRKIEQNLADCTAVSPAAHAAASYAAAAVDPACAYALQFPDVDGPLVGFTVRTARQFDIGGRTVAEAERVTGARILSVNGVVPALDRRIGDGDRVVACGAMRALSASHRYERVRRQPLTIRKLVAELRMLPVSISHTEPILMRVLAAGLAIYLFATAYFMWTLHLDVVTSMYFVTQTMATVGYGDITPYQRHANPLALVFTMFVILAGISISGVFIASVAAALNRAQTTALQGLRQIHAQDHVVVCGAGNVGTRVIDFLLQMGQRVTVVEQRPSSFLVELARDRRVDLLTGDVTSDDTLAFCDLVSARSFVAVTDSDAANLEAALGARVQNSGLSVIMRITDPLFARSIERNFTLTKSFSNSELTAPLIAGLSRSPEARGRVDFDGETYAVFVRAGCANAAGGHPLFVWREGNLVPVHDLAQVQPSDRLLAVERSTGVSRRRQDAQTERSR